MLKNLFFILALAASSWNHYTGGIYDASMCDQNIDHAVLLVGYGTGIFNNIFNYKYTQITKAYFQLLQATKVKYIPVKIITLLLASP